MGRLNSILHFLIFLFPGVFTPDVDAAEDVEAAAFQQSQAQPVADSSDYKSDNTTPQRVRVKVKKRRKRKERDALLALPNNIHLSDSQQSTPSKLVAPVTTGPPSQLPVDGRPIYYYGKDIEPPPFTPKQYSPKPRAVIQPESQTPPSPDLPQYRIQPIKLSHDSDTRKTSKKIPPDTDQSEERSRHQGGTQTSPQAVTRKNSNHIHTTNYLQEELAQKVQARELIQDTVSSDQQQSDSYQQLVLPSSAHSVKDVKQMNAACHDQQYEMMSVSMREEMSNNLQVSTTGTDPREAFPRNYSTSAERLDSVGYSRQPLPNSHQEIKQMMERPSVLRRHTAGFETSRRNEASSDVHDYNRISLPDNERMAYYARSGDEDRTSSSSNLPLYGINHQNFRVQKVHALIGRHYIETGFPVLPDDPSRAGIHVVKNFDDAARIRTRRMIRLFSAELLPGIFIDQATVTLYTIIFDRADIKCRTVVAWVNVNMLGGKKHQGSPTLEVIASGSDGSLSSLTQTSDMSFILPNYSLEEQFDNRSPPKDGRIARAEESSSWRSESKYERRLRILKDINVLYPPKIFHYDFSKPDPEEWTDGSVKILGVAKRLQAVDSVAVMKGVKAIREATDEEMLREIEADAARVAGAIPSDDEEFEKRLDQFEEACQSLKNMLGDVKLREMNKRLAADMSDDQTTASMITTDGKTTETSIQIAAAGNNGTKKRRGSDGRRVTIASPETEVFVFERPPPDDAPSSIEIHPAVKREIRNCIVTEDVIRLFMCIHHRNVQIHIQQSRGRTEVSKALDVAIVTAPSAYGGIQQVDEVQYVQGIKSSEASALISCSVNLEWHPPVLLGELSPQYEHIVKTAERSKVLRLKKVAVTVEVTVFGEVEDIQPVDIVRGIIPSVEKLVKSSAVCTEWDGLPMMLGGYLERNASGVNSNSILVCKHQEHAVTSELSSTPTLGLLPPRRFSYAYETVEDFLDMAFTEEMDEFGMLEVFKRRIRRLHARITRVLYAPTMPLYRSLGFLLELTRVTAGLHALAMPTNIGGNPFPGSGIDSLSRTCYDRRVTIAFKNAQCSVRRDEEDYLEYQGPAPGSPMPAILDEEDEGNEEAEGIDTGDITSSHSLTEFGVQVTSYDSMNMEAPSHPHKRSKASKQGMHSGSHSKRPSSYHDMALYDDHKRRKESPWTGEWGFPITLTIERAQSSDSLVDNSNTAHSMREQRRAEKLNEFLRLDSEYETQNISSASSSTSTNAPGKRGGKKKKHKPAKDNAWALSVNADGSFQLKSDHEEALGRKSSTSKRRGASRTSSFSSGTPV